MAQELVAGELMRRKLMAAEPPSSGSRALPERAGRGEAVGLMSPADGT